MKTEFQVLHLLEAVPIQTREHWELIKLFCQNTHIRIGTFKPTLSPEGITSPEFLEWYWNGYGSGDWALLDGVSTLISECDTKIATTAGFLSPEGWKISKKEVKISELGTIDCRTMADLDAELSMHGLEFDRQGCKVIPRVQPKINDRVLIWNRTQTKLGVIRSVDVSRNEVELYCWFDYNTKAMGYSMHEKDVVTWHEYHFEPMTIVAQRRMNRELEKKGKVWYDKLHRIEPLKAKVEMGEPYWYVDDKMKLVQATEKGTPTSHFRYIAGNYFLTHEEGLEWLGRITELLRSRLAQ